MTESSVMVVTLSYDGAIVRWNVAVKIRPHYDGATDEYAEHDAIQHHGNLHPLIAHLQVEILQARRQSCRKCIAGDAANLILATSSVWSLSHVGPTS